MTESLEERINKACPHCAAGNMVRQRTDTGEWVHDWATALPGGGHNMRHVICGAHKIRCEGSDG